MSRKIILASASPRRKDLLEFAGIPFRILVPNVDESLVGGESPTRMVSRLSQLKARAVMTKLPKGTEGIILAADTTVVSDKRKILGKPANHREAVNMIRALQGKAHHVLTGYTLIKTKDGKVVQKKTRVIRTDVFIKKMNSKEILAYIKKGESADKAGAYAAQGFGMALIEKIKGSYTNVVGLPVSHVIDDLKTFGYSKK